MAKQQRISLKLTDEQRRLVKSATGKDAEQLEFGVEELEERIAPSKLPTLRGLEGEVPEDEHRKWVELL